MPTYSGFTDDRAKSYDARVRKHIPGYQLLHDLSEILLAGELPTEASILVVGSGTGHEILEWAPKHPGWSFLGADPASAMIALAQQRVAEADLAKRVRLHVGSLESAPPGSFDAATLLLVLHFVPDDKKEAMLAAIAERAKPGAPILLASIFGDPDTTRFKRLNAARKTFAIANGLTPEMAEEFCAPRRVDMHIVPEERIKEIFRNAGWIDVQRVFQALTVGLWFARKNR